MFVLVDRDGVINRNLDGKYISSWDEFEFLPGSIEALKQLAENNIRCAIVSNQSGVNKGELSENALYEIDSRMHAELRLCGCRVEKTFYCVHREEEGCECRKPKPGLLFTASRELKFDLSKTFFVGDYMTDVEAGVAAGTKTILVMTGRGEKANLKREEWKAEPDYIAADLKHAVDIILKIREKMK